MAARVDLWITSMAAWVHRESRFGALLSADERTRRDRFIDRRAGQRFALGRGLLRAVLGHRLGIDPADVAFETGEGGKPRLAAGRHGAGLRFNVSGSGDRLAIAVSKTGEVGVDVEAERPVDDAMLRSSAILTDGERAQLEAAPAVDRGAMFLRWWVRKEAVAKADGRGVALGFSAIEAGPGLFDAAPRLIGAGRRSFLICDADTPAGAFCAVAFQLGEAPAPDRSVPLVRRIDYRRILGGA